MKRLLLINTIIYLTFACAAQSVDKLLATQVAWANHTQHTTSKAMLQHAAIDTSATEIVSFANKAPMYKVQFEDGWSLVSSELAAPPILAYCEHGTFPNYDDMSDGLKWFLEMYEDNLAYIRDSSTNRSINEQWNNLMKASTKSVIIADTVRLERMTQFKWGQTRNNDDHCSPSYNQTCPPKSIGICGHAPVGCVAVAMAGIMYYYKWPYGVDAPDYMHSISSTTHFYDWDNIPDYLSDSSSDYEAFQVTQVLSDCGKSINMVYGDSSSTSNALFANSSLSYFKYNSNFILRTSYSHENWISKLKNEIDNGRPVMYSGQKDNDIFDGHTFILMGYNSDNQFNFNFGWRGDYNDLWLAFDSIIISSKYKYNKLQNAIVDISPISTCSNWYYYNDVYSEDFYRVVGGEINMRNITIEEGVSGIIYSGQGFRLTNGFHAKSGSNVHIAVKNIPNCNNSRLKGNTTHSIITWKSPSNKDTINTKDLFSLSPNPVNTILTINSSVVLSAIIIYTLGGQPILQTDKTEINVSSFPAGMYIVRAVTTTGEQLQSKFIKQ